MRRIICGLLAICLCSVLGRAEKPFAAIDVASTSERFSTAISKARQGSFRARLAFVAENEIAVTSVDRPIAGTAQLSTDFFTIVQGSLVHGEAKTLQTSTGEPELIALPSGGYLVDQGLTISFFDRNHQERDSKSIGDLCGLENFQVSENHDLISRVQLPFARNEAVLLVAQISRSKVFVLPDAPKQPQTPRTMYCWFDTNQGKPVIRVVGDPPTVSHAGSEIDRATVWNDGGYLAPSGIGPFRLRCENEQPHLQTGFLPHAVRGELRLCGNGDLLFWRDGHVQKKHLAKARPQISAESLDAPIIVLFTSHVHVGLFGGISGTANAEVFDYFRMKTILRLSPQDLPQQPGFSVTQELYAVSPSGKYLAVLSGSRLAVYELNDSKK